mmetsp:Transcript_5382/g.13883  ORF Transcript_5382/g.13883 Transcript_5382/m.13883 type:complete len:86 (+) Transcript_5382:108-365(+)
MKLPFFGGGAKNATIASTKTVDDEETSQRRKVNIVDIGRVEEENDGKETLTGYCSLSENLEVSERANGRAMQSRGVGATRFSARN